MFERQVLRYVERELETRWTELAGAFALDEEGTPSLTRPLTDPRYQKPYGGAYWQVASEGAPLLARVPYGTAPSTRERSAQPGRRAPLSSAAQVAPSSTSSSGT